MEGKCGICPSSVRYYTTDETRPSDDECYNLFHQPCLSCSAIDSQPLPLCYICQHLRLRHLVKCVDAKTRKQLLFPLRAGLVDDPLSNTCAFCRLVNHMVAFGLNHSQLSELWKEPHIIFLYLGLFEGSVPEGTSGLPADIQISFADSCIWVGDLHIDDVECTSSMSPVGEMVPRTLLVDKINECYETHSECRPNSQAILSPGFPVIDVIRRCLVEKASCRFVALSYVWGLTPQSSPLAALRSTVDEMKKDGGLPASKIPQTIEDAIELCVRLGERYLWADRLCIIQDDPEDQKTQIEAMGEIYTSAQIVLVATYGNSMEFGIPGISLPRKVAQKSEDILDLRVTNVVREIDDDPLSIWNSRGWTYQEAALSNRRLYFTNTRAFFECEQSICHEDKFNFGEVRDERLSTRLTIPEDGSRFRSFVRHLENYTPRRLTYRSDTYKALYGITKSLYPGADAFIHGLPVLDFDRALLWFANSGKNAGSRHESQGEVLPTWSWSSVMGPSELVQYQQSHFYGTLAPWCHINGNISPSGFIAAFNLLTDSEPVDDWQVYMTIAIKEGCVESISLPFSPTTDNFRTVRELFNSRWPDYHSFCREAIPLTINKRELPNGISTHGTEKGLIATLSQTARLRLVPEPPWFVNIVNSEGRKVGTLCGPAKNLQERALFPEYNSGIEFEFIAISLSGLPSSDYPEALGRKEYTDVDGNSLTRVPVVNALTITQNENGSLARRCEFGQVELIEWAKLRREWKVVVLE